MNYKLWYTHLLRVVRFLLNNPLLALIIFSVFWILLLSSTGTLTSGYHLIDDHEMIRINADLQHSNYFNVTADWLSRDLGLRFRPVYIIHRVLTVQLLGVNFLAFSIQSLVLAIMTTWLLYMFCRQIGMKLLSAYLFPFLALVGAQAAIWWRLGPNETIGMSLFALGLYFLSRAYKFDYRSRFHKYLALAFFILASFSKESFVMMIPAILFINYFLFERKYKTSIRKTILQSKWFNALLSGLFAVEGLIIVFVIGANKIGYAGADAQTFSPAKLIETFNNLASDSNSKLLVFMIVIYAGLLIVRYDFKAKLERNRLSRLVWAVLAFAIIVFPQVVLYTKSGIYERYMVPGVLGFALLSAFLFQEILSCFQRNWLRQVLTLGLLALVALLFYPYFKLALINARAFTQEGVDANNAISAVSNSTSQTDTIIIAAEPVYNFEDSYSLERYLTLVSGKANLYLDVLSRVQSATQFELGLEKGFVTFVNLPEINSLKDKTKANALFVFKDIEDILLERNGDWFKQASYTRQEFGKYVVYTKVR